MLVKKIALIEPYFSGSHKQWAEGFKKYSAHQVEIFRLPARHWKWRMHGAAITLANAINSSDVHFDYYLVSDFLNVSLFKSLLKQDKWATIFIYFHENQLTYPKSELDTDVLEKRDNHYGFINYSSALIADRVFFNSKYHKDEFLSAAETLLRMFPDYQNLSSIESIRRKSQVLYLGLELPDISMSKEFQYKVPVILWNHRWEYDKNPQAFFDAIRRLKDDNIEFRLIILGEQGRSAPNVFAQIKEEFNGEIIHWGFVEDRREYWKLLQCADILPVTSNQDFFGMSTVEAIHAGVWPLIPNRLAYAEHFTDQNDAKKCTYNGPDELVEKLKHLCINIEEARNQKDSLEINSYQWHHMIHQYDSIFRDPV